MNKKQSELGTGGGLDKLRMQLIWDRFLAVVEEQAQTLVRTAFSTSTREAGDLSAGLFDRGGLMVVQALTGTPGHVNAMAASVQFFLEHYPLDSMSEGDVYVTNDPWMGTGHLHDFTVVAPVHAHWAWNMPTISSGRHWRRNMDLP